MKKFLILALLLLAKVHALTLKEKLDEASLGSYVVTQQGHVFTFLRIYNKEGGKIYLEELTIPEEQFKRTNMNWRTWFTCGAPGNTSWNLLMINSHSGVFEGGYSFRSQQWLDTSSCDSFLTTLLNVNFTSVPEDQRKMCGKGNSRTFWNPKFIVEGSQCDASFEVYRTTWPSDRSELAGKTIDVYLPISQNGPTFFPTWISVEGNLQGSKIRVIDSGMYIETTSLTNNFVDKNTTTHQVEKQRVE